LKICFVIPTLGQGGAQKVLVDLANNFSSRSARQSENLNEVSIVTFATASHTTMQTPAARVSVHHLNAIAHDRTPVMSLFRCFYSLRKLISENRPDVVVAFQDIANFPAIFACVATDSSLVVSERQDPSFYRLAKLRSALRWMLYRNADCIVVQTDAVKKRMESVLQSKVCVVPNAIAKPNMLAQPGKSANGKYRMISVGRLSHQKNFPLLIDAVSRLAVPENWTLHIFGEGPLRESLQAQIQGAGMQDRIVLEGLSKSIDYELSRSHLFILPSLYEGFPNVLGEAIATGLPCVAYQDVSGVYELIDHQQNGLALTAEQRNCNDLAEAISSLLTDHEARVRMGQSGRQKAAQYEESSILNSWQNILTKAIEK